MKKVTGKRTAFVPMGDFGQTTSLIHLPTSPDDRSQKNPFEQGYLVLHIG